MSKKTKKAMSMLLVVALIAVIAIGGMLAYLTDRDSATNVFTVGDVDIKLTEVFDEDNATLKPGVDIQKEVKVENIGKNAAWVWVTVAVPKALDNGALHYTSNDADWIWEGPEVKPIHGVNYNEYTALYKTTLATNNSTSEAMTEVSLDSALDIAPNGDWYIVKNGDAKKVEGWNNASGNPVVYVNAYAIQVEDFQDVQAAYDAYHIQWGDKADAAYEDTRVQVNGNDKTALLAAINAAEEGAVIALTEDTTIAGYAATNKLVIEKAITLDLNGKTLTTESGWGGIDAKGGCSIINGTINHTGNTAAIKAFQVGTIKDVTINVTETAGKTKGGIVVQEGSGCYVGSIENVTITGATNGIETYRCGAREDLAIGSMNKVTIDATDTGISLSAPIGTLTNCNIEGDKIGINAYLYGPYSVSADLVKCTVTGATGIYAHDEVGKTNPGSLKITYDAATAINGGITQEFESEVSERVSITQK